MSAIRSPSMHKNGFSSVEPSVIGNLLNSNATDDDAIERMDEDEADPARNDSQRHRPVSLKRTKELLLAALRVWELKRGIRD